MAGILFAERFPGANAGERIAKAIAALSPSGTVDCTAFRGEQAISSDIFASIRGPGELLLGATTYRLTVPITIPSGWTIRGLGDATQFICTGDLPNLPGIGRTASALLYVKANQSDVVIRDLFVKGSYVSGAAGNTYGIYLGENTLNCHVLDCKVYNVSRSGIHLWRGNGHLIESNRTESNAICGIEAWGANTKILNNYSYRDAVSADGIASIQLINGSGHSVIDGNTLIEGRKSGIELNIGPTANVRVTDNLIIGVALGGIIGARAWAQVTIRDNVIEGTGGSGSDGDGIYIADCQRFHIADNQVTGALRTGASGIEIGGSSNNGIVTNNIVAGCWQGIHVTDSVGTVGQVLLTANFSFDNVDNKDYDNSSSGEKVHAYLNAFGPELEIGL